MHLRSLHHVSYAVPDPDKTESFAKDFGLSVARRDDDCLFMRTAGGNPWCYSARRGKQPDFLGLGFRVEDEADLDEAVQLHGATPKRELSTPGGGIAVTVRTPDDVSVDLVWGVEETSAAPVSPQLQHNAVGARTRYATPQSPRPLGPATLFRLGHLGLYVTDYAKTAKWLEQVLGLKLSDSMYFGSPEKPTVGFFRIDRGEEFVDHHVIFIGQRSIPGIHHISFEVQDYEAQFRSHRWLQQQGRTLNWGVGRHSLGSHVFDTWYDPDRFRFETFSDTDLVNNAYRTGNHPPHKFELDVWSSDPPDRYFE